MDKKEELTINAKLNALLNQRNRAENEVVEASAVIADLQDQLEVLKKELEVLKQPKVD